MRKIIVLFVIVLHFSAFAQVVNTLTPIDLQGAKFPCSMIKANDGNLLVGGAWNRNASVVKFNSIGDTIWTFHLAGENPSYIYDIVAISDSIYMATGVSDYFFLDNFFSYGNLLLISFNSNGELLWSKTYGSNHWDQGNKVIKSKNGGVVVCGGYDTSSPNSNGKYWVLRCTEEGDTLWTRVLPFGNHSEAHSIIEDDDESIYIAGSGVHIVKLDKDGNNQSVIDVSGRYLYFMVEQGNNFCFTGSDEIGTFIASFDRLGFELWRKYLDDGRYSDLLKTPDGAMISVAMNGSVTMNTTINLRKILPDGTTRWIQNIKVGEKIGNIRCVHLDGNKYVLLGWSQSSLLNYTLRMYEFEDKSNSASITNLGLNYTVKSVEKRKILVRGQTMDNKSIFNLYDMNGRKCISMVIDQIELTVDIPQSGLFFYRIECIDGSIVIGKVLVR